MMEVDKGSDQTFKFKPQLYEAALSSALTLCIPVTGSRYNITHFYGLAVEAGFYSGVVECLPVNPATWVRFLPVAGRIFLLYNNGAHRK